MPAQIRLFSYQGIWRMDDERGWADLTRQGGSGVRSIWFLGGDGIGEKIFISQCLILRLIAAAGFTAIRLDRWDLEKKADMVRMLEVFA